MKLILKLVSIVLASMILAGGQVSAASAYSKTRLFVCNATLYGVDYDIQTYVGKIYHCKPIWDEMVREEIISFNQK